MIIMNCDQNSEQWFAEKLGKASASKCSKIVTNEGKRSKQREGYLYELAAEIITGRCEEGYKNANMELGLAREQEARTLFEMINSVAVDRVGVVYKDEDKKFLCSPDGIIGGSEGVEIKNPLPKTQAKYLMDGGLPDEYFGQIQFSLYVTGFKAWNFFSYVPAMRPVMLKAERDECFIVILDIELTAFCKDLDHIVSRIR